MSLTYCTTWGHPLTIPTRSSMCEYVTVLVYHSGASLTITTWSSMPWVLHHCLSVRLGKRPFTMPWVLRTSLSYRTTVQTYHANQIQYTVNITYVTVLLYDSTDLPCQPDPVYREYYVRHCLTVRQYRHTMPARSCIPWILRTSLSYCTIVQTYHANQIQYTVGMIVSYSTTGGISHQPSFRSSRVAMPWAEWHSLIQYVQHCLFNFWFSRLHSRLGPGVYSTQAEVFYGGGGGGGGHEPSVSAQRTL